MGEIKIAATEVGRELWSQRKARDRLIYRGVQREDKSQEQLA